MNRGNLVFNGLLGVVLALFGYGMYSNGRLRQAIEDDHLINRMNEELARTRGYMEGVNDCLDKQAELKED